MSGIILPAAASQAKTGGMVHFEASISTAKSLGKTLGMFSKIPPPVMWANALTFPLRRTGRRYLTYIFVGVKSSSPGKIHWKL